MSQLNTDTNRDNPDDTNSKSTQWVDLISALFDRLTGKEAVITYEFDNLVVDIPKAAGPGGKELGSAKWTINGRLIIKAEAHSQSKY
ncbi:MAG TPA: hypothetical protein VFM28_07620 [Nitrososphaeraceae archaeon]|jgi:hypothetical protein|nr:hypothetical protein [Nitrososphaeraceae archaeon]